MVDGQTLRIELTLEQREQIARASGRDLSAVTLNPEDWVSGYRERVPAPAGPIRVGRTLIIAPAGTGAPTADGDCVITLQPGEDALGRIFGTGAHITTQLALALLEERLAPRARVLDLGTGSGILALAAAHLGARKVVGLDLDPAAVAAARRNVAVNDLAGVVEIREGSLDAAPGPPYDLVVANIIAPVICRLARELADRVAPSGLLIVCGIIASRAPDVAAALGAMGLEVEEERSRGDWRALVLRKVKTTR